MAIVVRDDALANLGCTPHTDVRTFWKKIAEVAASKGPANMGDICAAIAKSVAEDYMADTVGEMFGMVEAWQIQQVMTAQGGKATWKGMVEYAAGMRFASAAPASADLVAQVTPLEGKPGVKREATYEIQAIGAALKALNGIETEILPEYVLNCHE